MKKVLSIVGLILFATVLYSEIMYQTPINNKPFATRSSKYDTTKSFPVGASEIVQYGVAVDGSDSVAVFVYTQVEIGKDKWFTFHTDSLVATSSTKSKGVVLRNLESATEVNQIKGAGSIRFCTKLRAGTGADSTGTFSLTIISQ